jgi:multimeric flavodoxin WrbA
MEKAESKMKILFLIGSYRRNGNTDQLTRLIKEHLKQEADNSQTPLEIETIYLGQENIGFCRGCRICYDRGGEFCPMKDDIHMIKAKMVEADGILLASPVYVDDVSGITKNFIDRLCHVCHRPQFAGKIAYIIATTGGTRAGKTLSTMKLALRTWGFHVVGQSAFTMGALMPRAETKSKFDLQTRQVAQNLFTAILHRKYLHPSFYELMVFKIQQMSWLMKGVPGTIDYEYWEKNGWFNPHRTFLIPIETSWLKIKLARATGVVISKFVLS